MLASSHYVRFVHRQTVALDGAFPATENDLPVSASPPPAPSFLLPFSSAAQRRLRLSRVQGPHRSGHTLPSAALGGCDWEGMR
jgi:hypothetical protein